MTLVSVSETTAIFVPQQGQLVASRASNRWSPGGNAYLVAIASISTRTSSRGNPVTTVDLAGLCFPKNFA